MLVHGTDKAESAVYQSTSHHVTNQTHGSVIEGICFTVVFIVPFNKEQLPKHTTGKSPDLSHIYQRVLCRKHNLQVHCDSAQVLLFQCLEIRAHTFKGVDVFIQECVFVPGFLILEVI